MSLLTGITGYLPIARAASDRPTSACYPGNEYSGGGSFSAHTNSFSKPSATGTLQSKNGTEKPISGKVTWRFASNVKGSTMTGTLSITINWDGKKAPDTTFIGRCISEAALDGKESEAEFEGLVTNFPANGKRDPRNAVASFNVDSSQKFTVGIEFGVTCHEGVSEGDWEFSMSGHAADLGEFWPGGQTSWREGYPAGFGQYCSPPN
jgi:hypothetical protein